MDEIIRKVTEVSPLWNVLEEKLVSVLNRSLVCKDE